MNTSLMTIRRRLNQGWSWWVRELGQILPDSLQSRLASRRQIDVNYSTDEVLVRQLVGTREKVLYQGPVNQPLPLGVKTWSDKLPAADKRLLLSSDYLLEKEVSMPLATEENLREALAYQLDHLTPFSSEQVYFDYLVVVRDKQEAKLKVRLFVAPKAKINPLLNGLEDVGFTPHYMLPLEMDEPPAGFNLLPLDARAKTFNTARWVNAGLILVCTLLAIVAAAYPAWHKYQVVEQLKPMVKALETESASVAQLREKVDGASKRRSFLTEQRQNNKLVLELLNELTFITPDDTWITQFDIKEGEVHIYGHSPSSAALLQRIDASNMFNSAQFRSPVTQSRQNNTERFHISAVIVPGEQP